MNTLDLESAAIIANALPTYMPGSTAYFLDTRAKRIVKLEVIKSVITHSLASEPDAKPSFNVRKNTSAIPELASCLLPRRK